MDASLILQAHDRQPQDALQMLAGMQITAHAVQGFVQDSTHCLAGAAESGVGLASALAAAGVELGLETKRLSASSMRVSRLLASVSAFSSSSTCTHIHTLGLRGLMIKSHVANAQLALQAC